MSKFTISSGAFEDEGVIPTKYSCDGEDISPPLGWSGVPEQTASLALIVDDPDAPGGTFVHWVIYNIPPDAGSLPEAVPSIEVLDNEAKQGSNDFGNIGYGGPCPPGGTHRYFFKLYALDAELDLDPGATKIRFLDDIEGNIIEEAQLMGHYSRD